MKKITDTEIREAIESLRGNQVKSHFGMIGHDGRNWIELDFRNAFTGRIAWFLKSLYFKFSPPHSKK